MSDTREDFREATEAIDEYQYRDEPRWYLPDICTAVTLEDLRDLNRGKKIIKIENVKWGD